MNGNRPKKLTLVFSGRRILSDFDFLLVLTYVYCLNFPHNEHVFLCNKKTYTKNIKEKLKREYDLLKDACSLGKKL